MYVGPSYTYFYVEEYHDAELGLILISITQLVD